MAIHYDSIKDGQIKISHLLFSNWKTQEIKKLGKSRSKHTTLIPLRRVNNHSCNEVHRLLNLAYVFLNPAYLVVYSTEFGYYQKGSMCTVLLLLRETTWSILIWHHDYLNMLNEMSMFLKHVSHLSFPALETLWKLITRSQ